MIQYSYLNRKFKKALYLSPEEEKRKKLIWSFVLIAFALTSSTFLLSSALSTEKLTASTYNQNQVDIRPKEVTTKDNRGKLAPLLKDDKEKTNILLIGIPGRPWPAPYLTDSIEVVSIDNKNKKIFVVAIPRDLLVKIPNSYYETRINALYSIEQNPKMLQEKVKEITGIETQYYAVIDLQTIEEIINTLGGIEVIVKEAIYDPYFPTASRGYETFSIAVGPQPLDGKTAIKYIRSRHQPRGDFGRIERQQQVMDAIREKVMELNLFSDFSKILSIFGEIKGKTNIGAGEIKTMTSLAKEFKKENIKYLLINADGEDSLLLYGKTILGKNLASVIWPKAGKFDYKEIKSRIQHEFITN